MQRCAPVRLVRSDGVPVFELHAQGQSVAGDGGVVHEDVELAEFREKLLEAGFHLRGIGYVHGNG